MLALIRRRSVNLTQSCRLLGVCTFSYLSKKFSDEMYWSNKAAAVVFWVLQFIIQPAKKRTLDITCTIYFVDICPMMLINQWTINNGYRQAMKCPNMFHREQELAATVSIKYSPIVALYCLLKEPHRFFFSAL